MSFRRFVSRWKKTPLHPQWFAFYRESADLRKICSGMHGMVVDIGCAECKPKSILSNDSQYLGIDYYATAKHWYFTRPDVFADAHYIPLRSESVDNVLLLDVLEHLVDPDKCLKEIFRVLKPGGTLTIQVPFLYPIHDAPRDFLRWTRYGLLNASQRHGFEVLEEEAIGHPLESAALNTCIAVTKTVLNAWHQKSILSIFALFLPFIVVSINVLAWLGARLTQFDSFMPYGYRMKWAKN